MALALCILFVGTKRQAAKVPVAEAAENARSST
jgi:ribosomal protein S2